MKITKSQQEEIDFFSGIANPPFEPTQQEKEDYIKETVHGIKRGINRISEAKRFMDITIPMWREDLVNGLLSIDELYNDEEFKKFPYAKKIIDSVLKSLNFNKYQKDKGFAVISMANAIKKYEIRQLKNNV